MSEPMSANEAVKRLFEGVAELREKHAALKASHAELLKAAKTASETLSILKGLDLGTFYVSECEQRVRDLRAAIANAEKLK